jgi:thioredoxin-dependent peroxiredoxin
MFREVVIMKKFGVVLAVCFAIAPSFAHAVLKPGAVAPDFTVEAAIGGKDFRFSLAETLKKGPVVVYFYPKSFTRGCTIEAHEFAENYENFIAAGAALIGLSSDSIEIQREFSTKECRDKFPVGADPTLSIINAYEAKRDKPSASGEIYADRISYVITPDGKISFVFADSNPVKHVENTLAVVRKWREEHSH